MKTGNLNFLEPVGHLGPVMGLTYLYMVRERMEGGKYPDLTTDAGLSVGTCIDE